MNIYKFSRAWLELPIWCRLAYVCDNVLRESNMYSVPRMECSYN